MKIRAGFQQQYQRLALGVIRYPSTANDAPMDSKVAVVVAEVLQVLAKFATLAINSRISHQGFRPVMSRLGA
jgi:hypothetical protein